jgi:hypothetical protein
MIRGLNPSREKEFIHFSEPPVQLRDPLIFLFKRNRGFFHGLISRGVMLITQYSLLELRMVGGMSPLLLYAFMAYREKLCLLALI